MLNQLGKGGAVYPLPAKNHLPFLPFSVFLKSKLAPTIVMRHKIITMVESGCVARLKIPRQQIFFSSRPGQIDLFGYDRIR